MAKKTEAEFMPTTQPADWLAAFRAEAERQGTKLSIWVGDQCRKGLPPDVRKGLSKRVQGRPTCYNYVVDSSLGSDERE